MSDDTPTKPIAIPSAAGIVAKAGKEPLPVLLDLNRDGILDAEQKWFWHGIADGAYWLLARVFPAAVQTQLVKAGIPKVREVINVVAK